MSNLDSSLNLLKFKYSNNIQRFTKYWLKYLSNQFTFKKTTLNYMKVNEVILVTESQCQNLSIIHNINIYSLISIKYNQEEKLRER